MLNRLVVLAAVAAISNGTAVYAGAADKPDGTLPAVSAINGKMEAEFGSIAHVPLATAAGSLSVPFAERFGVQADGLAGRWNGDALAGGALHLFWRDPFQALIGVYVSRLRWSGLDGVNASRAGFETELYLEQFTVDGFIGGEFGDIDSRFSSRLRLNWYFTDDLRLAVGTQYLGGKLALTLGGEWLLPTRFAGAALFVDGRIADRDHTSVWGGLRVYVGAPKSLIRRHREDDPPNNLTDDAGMFGGLSAPPSTSAIATTSGGPPPPPPPPLPAEL